MGYERLATAVQVRDVVDKSSNGSSILQMCEAEVDRDKGLKDGEEKKQFHR